MTRLFCGSLQWEVTEDDIVKAFTAMGHPPTEVKVVLDKDTGRSRGFGFATVENGQQCMDELNGMQLLGREITLSVATEKSRPARR